MKKGAKGKGSKTNVISEEERELFLNAVHQGTIPKKKTEKKNEPISESEKTDISKEERDLFLKAYNDLYISEHICTKEERKNRTPKRKIPKYIDATVDLHGMYVEEAIQKLLNFINDQIERGSKNLLIIHGRGTGALRQAVFSLIDSHPHVHNYKVAPGKYGGEGAIIIRIGTKVKQW